VSHLWEVDLRFALNSTPGWFTENKARFWWGTCRHVSGLPVIIFSVPVSRALVLRIVLVSSRPAANLPSAATPSPAGQRIATNETPSGIKRDYKD